MRKNHFFLILIIWINILLFVVIINNNNENELDTQNIFDESYKVERVIDGDTIVCYIKGESVTVRLIGVDTPESVHSDENKNCDEGVEASNFTKKILEGKMIYLEYDEDIYDDYDRVLAYVYLQDKSMFNSMLIEKGFAQTMKIEPNVKYADVFEELQESAKENNIGFWDGYFD